MVLFVLCYIIYVYFFFFFFKQKTAYEMRISDWSSDVCASDLVLSGAVNVVRRNAHVAAHPAANAIARRPPSTPRKSISIATPLLIYSVPGLAPVHPGRVYIVDDAVDGCASGHAHERACWWHWSGVSLDHTTGDS